MSNTIPPTAVTWHDLVPVINQGITRDEQRYGTAKHGLRGLFCHQVGELVIVGHISGDPALAIAALLAKLSLQATGDSNDTGIDDLASGYLDQFGTAALRGFAALASSRVTARELPQPRAMAIQFKPVLRTFGPHGDQPILHHLLGYAITVAEHPLSAAFPTTVPCDRNLLRGAF